MRFVIDLPNPEDQKKKLYDLLQWRRDLRWRRGVLQAAVSFGVINQAEWEDLSKQVYREYERFKRDREEQKYQKEQELLTSGE